MSARLPGPAPTIRHPAYRLLQGLVYGALRLTSDLQIGGRENYPPRGPYLIVFNHLHWLDLPLVFVTLRHQVATLTGQQLADHPLVGPVARHIGHAIFVQRPSDHRSLGEAIGWLERGGVLLMSPEGARSRTGALSAGRPGAAYLASRTGVPIVPLAAWGHERLFVEMCRGRRPRLRVAIGRPFVLPGTPSRAKGRALGAYTDQIMLSLAALLPPAYRGVYADRVGADGGRRASGSLLSESEPPSRAGRGGER